MDNDDSGTHGRGHIVSRPNWLRAKLGKAPGPALEEIVAAAEAALEELKDDYEVWIREDVLRLATVLAELRAAPQCDSAALERLQVLSHEIKGQGTTFGYPLLTAIAQMLCRFIEDDPAAAARQLDLVAAYVEFMNLVVAEKIRDDGGPRAREILDALATAAGKGAAHRS